MKTLTIFTILLLSYLNSFGQSQPPRTTGKNSLIRSNIFVNSGTSLKSPFITNAAPGSIITFGSGGFPITNFIFNHGVTYIGQGMRSTILYGSDSSIPVCLPGSAIVRNLTIAATNTANFSFPLGRIADPDPYMTNALFENVELIGSSDNFFAKVDDTNTLYSAQFRNCLFKSGWDSIVYQGTPYGGLDFVNCDFTIDVNYFPNALNAGSRQGRFLNIHTTHGSGNIRFKNCTLSIVNSLRPLFLEEGDLGGFDTPPYYLEFDNFSIKAFPTNSLSSTNYIYYSVMDWTNIWSNWQNVNLHEVRVVDAIYTNGPSPHALMMVNTVARTNWLPRINQAGKTNTVGLELLIKDAAGTAGTGNISVRPLGGATINGAAVYTINVNYGSARFRTLGTNWITVAQ